MTTHAAVTGAVARVKRGLAIFAISIPWVLLAVGVGGILAWPLLVLVSDGEWVPALAVYGGVAIAVAFWWGDRYLSQPPPSARKGER